MNKPATEHTIALWEKEKERYAGIAAQNLENADKGLLAKPERLIVTNAQGKILYDLEAYDFLSNGDAQATAHPLLWEQGRLTAKAGLYQICEGIWQVRGFDIANLTLIKGRSGYIAVDALMTAETARKAMDFAFETLERLPVKAVILTHPHTDHFGGLAGLLEYCEQDIHIVAPAGYLESLQEEGVLAGTAMRRRASYQFGTRLKVGARGHIGCGLGLCAVQGQSTMLPPTDYISFSGEKRILDGVEIEFELTPEAECPAEMCFYLPCLNALCMAEIVSHTLHNVLPIRGTKARSAGLWAEHILKIAEKYPHAEILFMTHHWAVRGRDEIQKFMLAQHDMYKFIHDQTVRLINHGMTPQEIAESVSLPKTLQNMFSMHGFYGNLKQNVKATYQYYLGWFDANPAHMNPLPPAELGKKYLEAFGGEEKLLQIAKEYFAKGEYRFAAELLNHFVFGSSQNAQAKNLLADTYEQLGYQSESAPWRNMYLTACDELRTEQTVSPPAVIEGIFNMPWHVVFKWLATHIDPERAEGKEFCCLVFLKESGEIWHLCVRNGVFTPVRLETFADFSKGMGETAEALDDAILKAVLAGKKNPRELSDVLSEKLACFLEELLAVLEDMPAFWFNIVTP